MKTKVFQIIECGELSGCGRLVAQLCNRLDPSRFEVTLVYATRSGAADRAFRRGSAASERRWGAADRAFRRGSATEPSSEEVSSRQSVGKRPTSERRQEAASGPEDFAAAFHSSIRKVHFPEMVRPVSPSKDLRALWKLYALLREERPGVVHCHSSKAGFLGRLAARAAGVPRVFYSPHGYSFRMTDAGWAARKIYWAAEWLASRFGTILVNAPNELEAARRLAGPARAIACYNGIDSTAFEPSYPDPNRRRLVVASCGRITAAKNPAAFLRLCARLAPAYPAVEFRWIGGGAFNEQASFISLLRRFGLEGRCSITGWLDWEGARRQLADADIVVHYSLWDVLPTAVLEAMALGKPVVGSTAVDQIRDGETGFVARSEEELGLRVEELLESGDLRAAMGRRARRVVERDHDFDGMLEKIETAYDGQCCDRISSLGT